jgi:hypothetical protein
VCEQLDGCPVGDTGVELRCSSLKYSRYSHSSRLAKAGRVIVARAPGATPDLHHGLLTERDQDTESSAGAGAPQTPCGCLAQDLIRATGNAPCADQDPTPAQTFSPAWCVAMRGSQSFPSDGNRRHPVSRSEEYSPDRIPAATRACYRAPLSGVINERAAENNSSRVSVLKEARMSRQWMRLSEGCVGRAVVALLVLSVVNVSVPAVAGQAASDEAPSTSATAGATISRPLMSSLADEASRQVRGAFERSMAIEARHLALAAQGSGTVESSGHWCAGGFALLLGGVAAAVVSGLRRNPNAQKPSPPVGVVLGTSAAAVWSIEMIRACRW